MKSILVDTNILVSALVEDGGRAEETRKVLESEKDVYTSLEFDGAENCFN